MFNDADWNREWNNLEQLIDTFETMSASEDDMRAKVRLETAIKHLERGIKSGGTLKSTSRIRFDQRLLLVSFDARRADYTKRLIPIPDRSVGFPRCVVDRIVRWRTHAAAAGRALLGPW